MQADRYRFGYHTLDFRSASKRWFSWGAEYTTGESFNGDQERYELDGRVQFTRHFSMSMDGEIDNRKYPITPSPSGTHGGDFTAQLTRLRATYSFNPDMYMSSFVQWENESDLMSMNTRFRWTLQPERELFVVLNLGGYRQTRTLTQRDTALKFAYNWRF